MDYLQATTPDGLLHASTCDSPPGFGERFRQTMELQGYTVTRYTPEEYRQLRAAPNIGHRTPNIGGHSQIATPLPDVGQEIVTPLLGRCTVTHWLTWPDGTRTAVARGPKGEGMVREWEAAPSVVTPQPSEVTTEPLPVPELPPVPVAGGWQMPSLFEGLA